MALPFRPKQALDKSAALLDEVQGNMSIEIAERLLPMLPPITSDSHIHDNGCGTGAVTLAVMKSFETDPPAGLKISANDTYPDFVDAYNAMAKSKKWPAEATIMDSTELTFPDGIFSHSIANFVFMSFTKDNKDQKAIHHIRRTLRPDGVTAATIWEKQPHAVALMEATKAVRGKDAPELLMFENEWYGGREIAEAMVNAGYKEDEVKSVEIRASWAIKDFEHWAHGAWSYLGEPLDGWKREDEEVWDVAVNKIVEVLKGGDWYYEEDGVGKLRYVGTIVIAQKK